MSLRRVHCTVSGRVQGVGFRYFTQENAEWLGISGWVRNTWDGSVECEAQGDQEVIDEFLRNLHDGPPLSYVKKIQTNDIPVQAGESGFEVRY